MTLHQHSVRSTIGLALAIGAIAPSTAAARFELNPSPRVGSPGVVSTPAAVSGSGSDSTVIRNDARDAAQYAAQARSAALVRESLRRRVQMPSPTRVSGPSFDWVDAGVGAAGGLGLSVVLVGGGLVLTQRRGRRMGRPATS
jgi:hypothetical protein